MPTADLLPNGKWSVSGYRAGFNDQQGFSNISRFAVTFGAGVKDRAELFEWFRIDTRIDRDIRPLFTGNPDVGGLPNECPFVTSQCASALNLDTFEIQTGTETGQPGATITVGEQVGQRLYVKLRQGVGADNVSKFVLDYQLTNFLRFESTMTQGGSPTRTIMNRVQQSGADLIFMFSF